MYSINYVIATYSGISKQREKYDKDTPVILQKHMEVLSNNLKDNKYIKQVTIVQPLVKEKSYEKYYDIDKYVSQIEQLGITVVLLRPNIKFRSSYSQYIYAYTKFPDFCFYIVMEDDWIPFTKNFDEKLLENYKDYNYKGFHCAWVSRFEYFERHSCISVGIIDKDSFTKIIPTIKNNCYIDQFDFSNLFLLNNLQLSDYSNSGKNYMIPFWETNEGVIYEYALHLSCKYLLVPIQFLQLNNYAYVLGDYKKHSEKQPSKEVVQWIQEKNTCINRSKTHHS